jgi:hypothetical protein
MPSRKRAASIANPGTSGPAEAPGPAERLPAIAGLTKAPERG